MSGANVVIVGGGIAGSAIATSLAPAGLDVLVLERQVQYRDRVHGEFLQPWGVAEARQLGVEDALLGAGGGYTTGLATYGEDVNPEVAAANAVPLDMLIPDVAGGLNVSPPGIGGAELAGRCTRRPSVAASARGTRCRRCRRPPPVRYELDGNVEDVQCRLVIGADGRQSTIQRTSASASNRSTRRPRSEECWFAPTGPMACRSSASRATATS